MKVFIEQSGEPNTKNVFDKQTGKLLKTVPMDLTYPYPYGYILNTLAPDGDELDCYIITDTTLEAASIVDAEAIGLVEWFEDGEPDHKILMVIKNEYGMVDKEIKQKITNFAEHFFDNVPDKKYKLGDFLEVDAAVDLIKKSQLK